jgi:predicted phosphodiesterase
VKRALAILLLVVPAVPAGEPGPLPFHDGSVTIAVLPDTEEYARRRPHLFEAQTAWIADNSRNRNIAFAIHLGDITGENTAPQWTIARRSFALLDGKVPYALVPGNHDYDDASHPDGGARTLTRINEFFRFEDFRKSPHYGDAFEQGHLENTCHLLRIHDRDWLVLCLETGPRDEVVTWASQVLARHADRLAIVVTHAYLYYANQRYDHRRGRERASPHAWGNDGEELWQKLVRRHPNIMIVMSGHLASGYRGYRVDQADSGNAVHQMMCDYEKMRGGGMGYLRLLEFLPDRRTVQVRTYSPVLQQTLVSDLEEFTFTLTPATRTEPSPAVTPPDPG